MEDTPSSTSTMISWAWRPHLPLQLLRLSRDMAHPMDPHPNVLHNNRMAHPMDPHPNVLHNNSNNSNNHPTVNHSSRMPLIISPISQVRLEDWELLGNRTCTHWKKRRTIILHFGLLLLLCYYCYISPMMRYRVKRRDPFNENDKQLWRYNIVWWVLKKDLVYSTYKNSHRSLLLYF
jgi:hypothetical protein